MPRASTPSSAAPSWGPHPDRLRRRAPLHAARLAEKLGIDRVLIPAERRRRLGGRLPARADRLRGGAQPLRAPRPSMPAAINAMFAEMARRGAADRGRRGAAGAPDRGAARSADMRYAGQGHEILVDAARCATCTDDDCRRAAARASRRGYRALFSRAGARRRRSRSSRWILHAVTPAPGRPADRPIRPAPQRCARRRVGRRARCSIRTAARIRRRAGLLSRRAEARQPIAGPGHHRRGRDDDHRHRRSSPPRIDGASSDSQVVALQEAAQ